MRSNNIFNFYLRSLLQKTSWNRGIRRISAYLQSPWLYWLVMKATWSWIWRLFILWILETVLWTRARTHTFDHSFRPFLATRPSRPSLLSSESKPGWCGVGLGYRKTGVRAVAPHSSQVDICILNICFRRCAQLMAICRSTGDRSSQFFGDGALASLRWCHQGPVFAVRCELPFHKRRLPE